MTRYLVTPALPYANGQAHLGHLLEHVQVNTYVRALRMAGEQVLCVCGVDAHGAGIEIAAKKAGIEPEVYVEQVRAAQEASFRRFGIEFDGGYGSTHTDENERHAQRVYAALKAAGHIAIREVEQLQDPTDGRFLADRFVKGTCPVCKTADQYGDACESCGSTYRATELIEPKSAITGAVPVLGKSDHHMVTLAPYAERLRNYLAGPQVLHPALQNFLQRWFDDGLKDWDVSRDGPYFGFRIPGEANKFFYVWLDAPIGYVSLTERALRSQPATSWSDWWQSSETRIEHFIGKDILYFHTLFWPAMLMATGDTLPTAVRVHGMLTLNGGKMSKSRGTFILADDFAAACDPQALRYYFASKLTAEPQDIDLNMADLHGKVNGDVTNNLVNLVSRTLPLLHRGCGGVAAALDGNDALVIDGRKLPFTIEAHYRALDTYAAVKAIVDLGDRANKMLADAAPWDLLKTDIERARQVLSTALWVGKTCLALLKPVLPTMAITLERMLHQGAEFTFHNAADALPAGVLPTYERLFERIELKPLHALVQPTEPVAAAPVVVKAAKATKKTEEPPPAEIPFDDFARVDLRAARVLSAEAVAGSDKLIKVSADVGDMGVRTIFTGLRPHVTPEQLQGRTVVIVANLGKRQMAKFGESHGMILAAGEPPVPLFVDSTPGARVR